MRERGSNILRDACVPGPICNIGGVSVCEGDIQYGNIPSTSYMPVVWKEYYSGQLTKKTQISTTTK